jgi:thiol-disulfide isomerase/thioredoxin
MSLSVLKFGAKWCKPCRDIAPFVEEMKVKYPLIDFVYYDADIDNEKFEEYKVKSLPTFIFLVDGVEVQREDKGNVKDMLESTLRYYSSKSLPAAPSDL